MPEAQNLTFNLLLESLSSYMVRTDTAFLEKRPEFVMLAENKLATAMKQQGFQSVVSGALPLAVSMPKPAFWRETISFTYTFTNADGDAETATLYLRTLEFLKQYAPTAEPGAPVYYADYNISHFRIAPVPDAAYQFELVYYARLQPLSTENQTNWLTLNAPQALLYAALTEAAIWAGNDGKIALYSGMYDQASSGLVSENQERSIDRTTAVSRP